MHSRVKGWQRREMERKKGRREEGWIEEDDIVKIHWSVICLSVSSGQLMGHMVTYSAASTKAHSLETLNSHGRIINSRTPGHTPAKVPHPSYPGARHSDWRRCRTVAAFSIVILHLVVGFWPLFLPFSIPLLLLCVPLQLFCLLLRLFCLCVCFVIVCGCFEFLWCFVFLLSVVVLHLIIFDAFLWGCVSLCRLASSHRSHLVSLLSSLCGHFASFGGSFTSLCRHFCCCFVIIFLLLLVVLHLFASLCSCLATLFMSVVVLSICSCFVFGYLVSCLCGSFVSLCIVLLPLLWAAVAPEVERVIQ